MPKLTPSDVSGFLRKLASFLKSGQNAHETGVEAEELADKIDAAEAEDHPQAEPQDPPPGDPGGP